MDDKKQERTQHPAVTLTHSVNAKVNRDEYMKFDEMAESRQMTRSALAREILLSELARKPGERSRTITELGREIYNLELRLQGVTNMLAWLMTPEDKRKPAETTLADIRKQYEDGRRKW